MKGQSLKYHLSSVLFIVLALMPLYGQDSIIRVEDDSTWIAQSCALRKALISSVVHSDKARSEKLLGVKILYEDYSIDLTSKREKCILAFYLGDYQLLLTDIKSGEDFFKMIGYEDQDGYYPLFQCGNLSFQLLDHWKSITPEIHAGIASSSVSEGEKQVLKTYWDQILLYLEKETSLPPAFNSKGVELQLQELSLDYDPFIQETSTLRRTYSSNYISLGFGGGPGILTGSVTDYLKNGPYFEFYFGLTIRNISARVAYNSQLFDARESVILPKVDDLRITESDYVVYRGYSIELGYKFDIHSRWQLEPFVGFNFQSLENRILVVDSLLSGQPGDVHFSMKFGGAASLLLFHWNPYADSRHTDDDFYIKKEEYHIAMMDLRLNMKFGYNTPIFEAPTGIRGNFAYISAGLEIGIGNKRPHYHYELR